MEEEEMVEFKRFRSPPGNPPTTPTMSKTLVDLQTYKAFTEIPTYTSAEYIGDSDGHSRSWGFISALNFRLNGAILPSKGFLVASSVVDHTRNIKRGFQKTWAVIGSKAIASESIEINEEIILSRYSRSGRKKAVLREVVKDGDGSGSEKRRFVEIWVRERLEVVKEVTKFHGEFYNDGALFPSTLITWYLMIP
jgi:hypothetical protein